MKNIISSLSLLLVLIVLFEATNAQSLSPIPGTPFKVPQIVNPVKTASQEKSVGSAIQVSPNPCQGQFTVRFNSQSAGKVSVTVNKEKGTGMIVLDVISKIGINSIPVDISGYGNGTYMVTVSGAGVYGTVSVVVNRSSH